MKQTDYKNQSDERLMEVFIIDKSPEAFEIIYTRYFVALCKYVTWLSQDMQLAKDIAQNILMKIYDKPQLYDPSKLFKIWLFTVAKNNWKNEIRNQKVRQKHYESSPLILTHYEEQSYERDINQELNRIQNKIHLLSSVHREVIILKYANNLTIKEISEIIDCSNGTVKSRLFYAIKSLKELLNT